MHMYKILISLIIILFISGSLFAQDWKRVPYKNNQDPSYVGYTACSIGDTVYFLGEYSPSASVFRTNVYYYVQGEDSIKRTTNYREYGETYMGLTNSIDVFRNNIYYSAYGRYIGYVSTFGKLANGRTQMSEISSAHTTHYTNLTVGRDTMFLGGYGAGGYFNLCDSTGAVSVITGTMATQPQALVYSRDTIFIGSGMTWFNNTYFDTEKDKPAALYWYKISTKTFGVLNASITSASNITYFRNLEFVHDSLYVLLDAESGSDLSAAGGLWKRTGHSTFTRVMAPPTLGSHLMAMTSDGVRYIYISFGSSIQDTANNRLYRFDVTNSQVTKLAQIPVYHTDGTTKTASTEVIRTLYYNKHNNRLYAIKTRLWGKREELAQAVYPYTPTSGFAIAMSLFEMDFSQSKPPTPEVEWNKVYLWRNN